MVCHRRFLPMPRKQKRKQRKSRQGVMGQLRLDQGKDDENDGDAPEKILVDQFFAVAGGVLSAVALAKIDDADFLLSPQFSSQPWQLDRPRKETDEDSHE